MVKLFIKVKANFDFIVKVKFMINIKVHVTVKVNIQVKVKVANSKRSMSRLSQNQIK